MFDNAFEAGKTAGANSWETSWGCLLAGFIVLVAIDF